jgi:hypothetical protein
VFAMQYSFLLPADYDMSIVDRRIADRGHLTDHFAGLQFKAYLVARRSGGRIPSQDNFYAPFYVWNTTEGFNNFVCGDGFDGVSKAFGRVQIKTWMVWHSHLTGNVASAKFATRSLHPIDASEDLRELRRQADVHLQHDLGNGALASVCGFEPTTWTQVRFSLWRSATMLAAAQHYEVAHLSLP